MRYVYTLFMLILLACFLPGRSMPAIAPSPTTTPVLLQFEGQGDKIISFDITQAGPIRFGLVHHGHSNFIVELLAADGSFLAVLANEIDDYTGETLRNIKPGHYSIQVKADGEWTIIILPPQ